MSNANLNTTKKLRLTSIKKSQKCAGQVEIKLNCFYNQILILAIFVKYLRKIYNNKKLNNNIKAKQNIDTKEELSFFVHLHKFIQYEKMNNKDISDAIKLINDHIECLIILDTRRQL